MAVFSYHFFPNILKTEFVIESRTIWKGGGEGRIRIGVEGFQRSFNYVESQAILIVEEVSYRIELRV